MGCQRDVVAEDGVADSEPDAGPAPDGRERSDEGASESVPDISDATQPTTPDDAGVMAASDAGSSDASGDSGGGSVDDAGAMGGGACTGLLAVEGFDEGIDFDRHSRASQCPDGAIDGVTSPARTGGGAARLEVAGECSIYDKHRRMLHMFRTDDVGGVRNGRLADRTPYWIGWSVYVPADYPTSTEGVISAQLIGGGVGPETLFQIHGTTWRVIRRWWDSYDKHAHGEYSGPAARGRWTDWVMYIERSWQEDGVLRVWKDGELVVDVTGPNAYRYGYLNGEPTDDSYYGVGPGANWVIGVYWGYENRPGDYRLYFDEIRIAGPEASYDAVAPGSGCP
jgi:hypothetical protein